jgi:hypothetical protein
LRFHNIGPLLPAGRKFCKITKNRPNKKLIGWKNLAAVRPSILDKSGRKNMLREIGDWLCTGNVKKIVWFIPKEYYDRNKAFCHHFIHNLYPRFICSRTLWFAKHVFIF